MMMGQTDADREENDNRFASLAGAVERLVHASTTDSSQDLLTRVAEGQEALIKKIDDNGMDGIDAESRMRLRSIDVQLLRILEEMSAGRQESIGDLRGDLATLATAIKDRG
jgi:hypothetical protein